jgi:hypothetical protein
LELSAAQAKLHRLFIQALQAWAAATPLKKGLPVGLPASAVVANVALVELDRMVEQQLAPLYYGRYVDDILLVMENGASFRSTIELWEWLFARSGGKLGWVPGQERKQIGFQPEVPARQPDPLCKRQEQGLHAGRRAGQDLGGCHLAPDSRTGQRVACHAAPAPLGQPCGHRPAGRHTERWRGRRQPAQGRCADHAPRWLCHQAARL